MYQIRVRLMLKTALFIGCVIGFAYQAGYFLILYYSYPVDTSITIRHMNSLEMPAISMCNFNSYRRTEFCKMFPDKCEEWSRNSTVCTTWPYYCFSSEEPLFVPKVKSSQLITYNRSIHFELSHTYEGLVGRCELTINENDTRSCESFSPPFAFQCINDWFNPTVCHTINFYWLKENKEEMQIPDTAGLVLRMLKDFQRNIECNNSSEQLNNPETMMKELQVVLYPEEHEFFPDSWYPGFQVAVHSGKSIVNPFAAGYTFLSGRSYYIDLSMVETHLLQSPYRSHCEPYIPGWNAKEGAEPSNQQACENKCLLKRSLELYGCAIYTLTYPHNQTICSSQRELSPKEIKECSKRCPLPCYAKEYRLSVNEYPQYKDSPGCRGEKMTREWCTRTELHFTFSEFSVATYNLKPKYTYIEIFSNIGGYLGMWLGMSLLSLSDIIFPLLHNLRVRIFPRKRGKILARTPLNCNTAAKTTRNSPSFTAHGSLC